MTDFNDGNWETMDSAPRDGTLIRIGNIELDEWYEMRWNPKGYNSLFQPNTLGIWETEDKQLTWSEKNDGGPSHWQHVPINRKPIPDNIVSFQEFKYQKINNPIPVSSNKEPQANFNAFGEPVIPRYGKKVDENGNITYDSYEDYCSD